MLIWEKAPLITWGGGKEKGGQNNPSKIAENKMCYNYGEAFGKPQRTAQIEYVQTILGSNGNILKMLANPQIMVQEW